MNPSFSQKLKKGVGIGAACAAAVGVQLFLIAPGGVTKRQKAPFYGRSFAHRGLHAEDKSVPENSLEAFRLAAAAGYGVELDVQLTKDGQVVVFHDDTLTRVCGVNARVDEKTWNELRLLRLCGTEQRIPLLTEALAVIRGKGPLIVELKNGKRNRELCEKTYAILSDYEGQVCIESFNPMIVRWFRFHARDLVRGQLATTVKDYGDSTKAGVDAEFEVTIKWNTLTDEERKAISLSGGDLSTLDPLEQVKKLEKDYGVVFNHENSTTKIKMSDVLEEKNISIKEAVELDVLGYIEKNDVIKQDGKINGNISVIIGEFETTINGYKVRNGYEGSKNIYVLDSDNKNLVSFYLEIENDSSLSDGDTATITYDNYYKESALDAGFKLVGDDIKFTVKGGEALTADTAKNQVNEIKAYFSGAVKEEDSLSRDTDTLELKNIYFCSNNSENRIVCVYNNVTKKFFKTFYFSTNKVSIADGKLVNEGNADDSLSYKTIDEAVKNSRYLNGKNNFTVTKLL